ncbi:hypothetical protein GCM10022286_02350 [Gryllotalpicola daejeonensis]|uniref:D-isomer specific 2-hydroxyacid dehydrogenase NAD-binding domain-containing protein n=2 Tax=Gryllotalpicola daejeonensis TaxID=993087 RepID=A0ABP7ZDN7_9MICO
MIFSRRHNDVVDTFEAARDEINMLGLSAVGPALPLLDWVLMPHLGASFFPWATDEWAAESAARLKAPVWFLDDASALLVTDAAVEPEVVSQGHWLRFDETGALVSSR